MAEFAMTETQIVVSAEGVAGPPGPVGETGPQGIKGEKGDGVPTSGLPILSVNRFKAPYGHLGWSGYGSATSAGSIPRVVDGMEYPTIRSTAGATGGRRAFSNYTAFVDGQLGLNGEWVTVSVDLYIPSTANINSSIQLIMRDSLRNNSGAGVGSTSHASYNQRADLFPRDKWFRLVHRFKIHPGFGLDTWYFATTISNPDSDPEGFIEMTRVVMEEGYTSGEYFDGNTPGCKWTGTVNASTSVKNWVTREPTENLSKTPVLTNLSGEGSPENTVAAPVGTKYTDLLSTNGAVEWTKVSGNYGTGWRVTFGDTGNRNVTSLLAPTALANSVTIRRSGDVVSWTFVGVRASDASTAGRAIMTSVPQGFRPTSAVYCRTYFDSNMYITASEVRWNTLMPPSAGGDFLTITHLTSDQWPTTLPGTA